MSSSPHRLTSLRLISSQVPRPRALAVQLAPSRTRDMTRLLKHINQLQVLALEVPEELDAIYELVDTVTTDVLRRRPPLACRDRQS
jgi:hypothetical protein